MNNITMNKLFALEMDDLFMKFNKIMCVNRIKIKGPVAESTFEVWFCSFVVKISHCFFRH